MKLTIQPADLASDRKVIIETLARYVNPRYDEARFDWAYHRNPHGRGRAWIARETTSNLVVGTAAAFPRRVRVAAREVTGWVLGDFCVADAYRSLGPATQLQRACLADVGGDAAGFCYDFPSAAMMAVYARLSVSPAGRLLRLARPLRADRYVRARIKHPALARGVSAAANLVLGLGVSRTRFRRGLAVALHAGAAGEEFSHLADEIGDRHGICVQRSAEYLNWRYLATPLGRHELITARRDGALRGYVVFTQTPERATLVDLFAAEPDLVVGALVEGAVGLLRDRGVPTVSLALLDSHPWVSLLRTFGFRSRADNPIVIYDGSKGQSGVDSIAQARWFLTYGDTDG